MTAILTTEDESDDERVIADEHLHEGMFTVPDRLREMEYWVLFRYEEGSGGEQKKVPVMSDGSSVWRIDPTDTSSCTDFDGAYDRLHASKDELSQSESADGLGFVLSDEHYVVGYDLDDCFDATSGEISELALEIVNELSSFTEVSPSGTGLHVYARGALDETYQNKNDEQGLEVYQSDRFFTFTGRWIEGTPRSVEDRDVARVQREHFDESTQNDAETSITEFGEASAQEMDNDVELLDDDEELIQRACNSADDDFKALYEGTYHDPDKSNRDWYFAKKAVFWADDLAQAERIMRSSALERPKWDESRGNTTWIRYQLERANQENGR
jgi:primase-polymerase (primpol)-like protein